MTTAFCLIAAAVLAALAVAVGEMQGLPFRRRAWPMQRGPPCLRHRRSA
jgi:hypothetical protein